jgi:hypothetical protein
MQAAGHAPSAAGPNSLGMLAWPRPASRLHAEGPGECGCVGTRPGGQLPERATGCDHAPCLCIANCVSRHARSVTVH